MNTYTGILFFIVLIGFETKAQTVEDNAVGKEYSYTTELENRSKSLIYENAMLKLVAQLKDEKQLNFKEAVFISENAFNDDTLSYESFNTNINNIVKLCKALIESSGYDYDKEPMARNWSIHKVMTDTLPVITKEGELIYTKPCKYDFEDYNGDTDWRKMFVTKLLTTNTGQCHSLPYLYKILADEMGAEAYLALAPNHVYIKHRDEKGRWFNLELTNGHFITNPWLMASGYITLDAIQNRIYMEPLSSKESIALCLLDLALGYKWKYGYDLFVLDCAEIVISYFPNNVNALVIKGNALKAVLDKEYIHLGLTDMNQIFEYEELAGIYGEMERTFVQVDKLGYEQMPDEMYEKWLNSLEKEKNKQINQN